MAIKFRDVDKATSPKPAKPRAPEAPETLFTPDAKAEEAPETPDAAKKRGRPGKAKFRS